MYEVAACRIISILDSIVAIFILWTSWPGLCLEEHLVLPVPELSPGVWLVSYKLVEWWQQIAQTSFENCEYFVASIGSKAPRAVRSVEAHMLGLKSAACGRLESSCWEEWLESSCWRALSHLQAGTLSEAHVRAVASSVPGTGKRGTWEFEVNWTSIWLKFSTFSSILFEYQSPFPWQSPGSATKFA